MASEERRIMKAIIACVIFTAVIFFCWVCPAYSQTAPVIASAQTKTVDVNKDGKADVTYYHDGVNITKAEADTNYDGKPDVTVYVENGKFKSAEVDTDYDGKPDNKFSDTAEFNKWLNENQPDFKDSLGWQEWKVSMMRF